MLQAFSLAIAEENEWQLRKNKDGIQVFTRKLENKDIYEYKVTTFIDAKPSAVYHQLVNFKSNLKYMEMVDSLRFLDHQKDKLYRNYMRFKMPWPVKNRDMVIEMLVTIDEKGIYLESTQLSGYIPVNTNSVRISDFYEKWSIQEGSSTDKSKVVVSGWVDPGGNIPSWLVNLFSVSTPYQFISRIIQEIEGGN